jgi:NAD(P)H-quinone oxidoreductase subunit 5
MSYLAILLPFLALFPILINSLSHKYPKIRSNLSLFSIPVIFLFLAGIILLKQESIELTLFSMSSLMNISMKLDVLSCIIAATVSTIGIIVDRYTLRHLEDDPKKVTFSKNLSYTLSSVLFMLMATNLILFFLAWLSTSYFLHKLLTHFPEREGAIKAAEQKFYVSRLGDVFIILSGIILFSIFKSLEFQTLQLLATDSSLIDENSQWLNISSILLVLGAMTKSAQFPFHFWLPNTMETPTPVSALMHAGIINSGGYLIIRMSPLLTQTPVALSLLAIIGGFTALWATIVMMTQTNIKKSLAYSTISQMGFMMLQCGLGAFSLAVLHIVGHSFFKAYAFLSSGTATDYGKLQRYFPSSILKPQTAKIFLIPIFLYVALSTMLQLIEYKYIDKPGMSVLLLILVLAASQIILSSTDKFKSILMASAIVISYIILSHGLLILLKSSIDENFLSEDHLSSFTILVCSSFFVFLYLFQNFSSLLSKKRIGKIIYVKALNGNFN